MLKPDLLIDLLHLAFPVSDHLDFGFKLGKLFGVEIFLHFFLIFPVESLLFKLGNELFSLVIFLLLFESPFNTVDFAQVFWALIWCHWVPSGLVIVFLNWFKYLSLLLLGHLELKELLDLGVSFALVLSLQVLLLIHCHQVSYHVVVRASVLVRDRVHTLLKTLNCLMLHTLLRWVWHHFSILGFEVLSRAHIGKSLEAGLFQILREERIILWLEVVRVNRRPIHHSLAVCSLDNWNVISWPALRRLRVLV